MRLLLALSLFACMLCLASGCNLPKRLKEGTARNSTGSGSGERFLGTPPAESTSPTSADSGSDSTLASKQGISAGKGYFAGQVLDSARRRVPKATIKVIEIDPPKERADAAPLSVLTDNNGWFTIPGLDSGRWYRLAARVRDGNRILTGAVKVQCPNIRVAIALTGDEPATGQDKEVGIENEKGNKEDKKTSPGVKILAPIKAPTGNGTATPLPDSESMPAPAPVPSAAVPPIPPPVNSATDPSLMANEREKDGFKQNPKVTIPGPGQEPQRKPSAPYVPPPTPRRNGGTSGLLPSSAPSAVPSALPPAGDVLKAGAGVAEADDLESSRLVVPSCVKIGNRVDNLALFDYDGNVWELRRKRKGKLTLIDFWFSGCAPCRHSMPFLAKLDRDYRPYGLQVVGIAHEEGSLAEKQDAVRPIRTRLQINYPILFTGGGTSKNCPVLKQFEVHQYPTLILLDESGKIVWRGTGLNDRAKYDLVMDIRRRLGIRDGR